MAIAMFGYKLEASVSRDVQVIGRIVDGCAKRSNEKVILMTFIKTILPDLIQKVESLSMSSDQIDQTNRETVINFYLSELKLRKNSHFSVYDDLVFKLIEQDGDLSARKYIQSLKAQKLGIEVPLTFPSQRKRADAIVMGKLRSDIDKDEVITYLRRQELDREIRQISQDMFYAINNGLVGSEILKYLGVMYDLRFLETASSTNELKMKRFILRSLKEGITLNLVHVKCLRFSYPKGISLKLITHLGSTKIEDRFGGIFTTTDESKLFENLKHLTAIFEKNGIGITPLVMVADNDLLDNFPQNMDDIIPVSNINRAQTDTNLYIEELKKKSSGVEIKRLTEILEEKGLANRYNDIRMLVLISLRRGDPRFITEKVIEDMINYRFERDKALFEKVTRVISRERIYQKMASVIALQVLEKDGLFLVTNSHGNENKLVAGGKIPIFFTDLCEEKKVFENVEL
ncbi:MAG: hypothetical protein UU93_C0004G0030 [Candidatus Amesbacteria bacterium GW2011_GWA2_42_12]|uniref:Uncharacterized protein n=1 Tax=Candidatus Amesbacteria bacterium GW2011_GWA2_42_12 TaxID=1618356 RepID=A0A0G1B614_9BACT|nr:MAG: hypothetical protein UU93_C0004G0030 [Candidatus Amesbacteria bacterium GW2011_GWA2_42_12]